MKLLLGLLSLIATTATFTETAAAYPGYPGHHAPIYAQVADQYSRVAYLAATAPDSSVLEGRTTIAPLAKVQADVHMRADAVCGMQNLGRALDFRLGQVNQRQYINIGWGYALTFAPNELVRPYLDQYGRILGLAKGFAWVSCSGQ